MTDFIAHSKKIQKLIHEKKVIQNMRKLYFPINVFVKLIITSCIINYRSRVGVFYGRFWRRTSTTFFYWKVYARALFMDNITKKTRLL